MVLLRHSHLKLEAMEGGLFELGRSHLGVAIGVVGQSSFYDGQSDPGEIYF